MPQTQFRYELEDRPTVWLILVYGMQWLTVSIPFVIILGNTVAGIQYPGQPAMHISYLQKVFFITGAFLLAQVAIGHRLPLVVGPASVLLLGLAANSSASPGELAGSIAVGGILFAALSVCNVAARISALFTVRIISVVLLLIAFTMLPTIMRLVTADAKFLPESLLFAFSLLAAMLLGQRLLPGAAKSAIIMLALSIGSLLYWLLTQSWPQPVEQNFFAWWRLERDPLAINMGVLVSFLFCYAALWINDIGSIQTTSVLVKADKPEKRVKAGLILTGIGNGLAGWWGVIGPVNYSLSTGLIMASKCASRYTLFPAAFGMLLLAFFPAAIQFFAAVPSVVVGSLLLYMMGSQIAASFSLLRKSLTNYRFEDGLIIGIPLLLATLVSFLPPEAISSIPQLLRPLIANGFVVGGVAAMLLEHVIFQPGKS